MVRRIWAFVWKVLWLILAVAVPILVGRRLTSLPVQAAWESHAHPIAGTETFSLGEKTLERSADLGAIPEVGEGRRNEPVMVVIEGPAVGELTRDTADVRFWRSDQAGDSPTGSCDEISRRIVLIPDNMDEWTSSPIMPYPCGPVDGEVTEVNVCYSVDHARCSDLYVRLWCNGVSHTLWDGQECSGDGIAECHRRISTFAGLRFDDIFQWHLEAKDVVQGVEGEIQWWSIEVWYEETPPPEPLTLHLDLDFCHSYIELWWNLLSDATAYTVQVDDDGSFPIPEEIYNGTDPYCSYRAVPDGGTYCFRVRAETTDGSTDWSNTECVLMELADGPPLCPIENSDGDGDFVVSWGECSVLQPARELLTSEDELQEDTSPQFPDPTSYLRAVGREGLSVTFTGKSDGTYYYRVRSVTSDCVPSRWSNVESVTVATDYVFTGRVIDDNTGEGMTGVTVKLSRWQNGAWREINSANTYAPEGRYVVWAQGQEGKYAVEEINPPGYTSVRADVLQGLHGVVISPDRVEYDNPRLGNVGPANFYDVTGHAGTFTPTPSPTSTLATATPTPTCTPGLTSAPTQSPPAHVWVVLPLVLKKGVSSSFLINGDFEEGWTGWEHGGELQQSIESAPPGWRGKAALLGDPSYDCDGGVPVGQAWMSQTFTVPGDPVTLRFQYRVFTQDLTPPGREGEFDYFGVYLGEERVWFVANQVAEEGCGTPWVWDSEWQSFEYDLSAYQGQTVTLWFRNWSKPDGWYNTWTYIADVETVGLLITPVPRFTCTPTATNTPSLTSTPLTPTPTPVTPTVTPITPTLTPVTPTVTPITPTLTPVTPTPSPTPFRPANLSLSPSTGEYLRGSEFTADVLLNTNGAWADQVLVIVTIPGSFLHDCLLNVVDVAGGDFGGDVEWRCDHDPLSRVNTLYATVSSSRCQRGSFRVCTITFDAYNPIESGTQDVEFVFTPGGSGDSSRVYGGVEGCEAGEDILGGVTNAQYEIVPYAPASLSLSPSGGSYPVGSEFTIDVLLDTNGAWADLVNVVWYLPSGLGVVGVAVGDFPGNVDFWGWEGQEGRFRITAHSSSCVRGSFTAFRVTFRASAAGSKSVTFSYDSLVYGGEGGCTGEDILGNTEGGSYALYSPSPTPVTPTPSPTPYKPASLRLSPSSGTHSVGSEFTVDVLLDTGGAYARAALIELYMDPAVLEVSDVIMGDFSDALIWDWYESSNSLQIGVYSTSSYCEAGSFTACTVVFRGLSAGSADVTVNGASRMWGGKVDCAEGKDILGSVTGGSYTIYSPTPTPFSPASLNLSPSSGTHPVGSEFTVDVILDTGGAYANVADIVLYTDPSMLDVSNVILRDFSEVISWDWDDQSGRLWVISYCFDPGYCVSGSFTACTITFRGLGGGSVDVTLSSSDSGVYGGEDDCSPGGQDILGSVTGGSYEIH